MLYQKILTKVNIFLISEESFKIEDMLIKYYGT